jgi:outer membrane protein insertion porin family
VSLTYPVDVGPRVELHLTGADPAKLKKRDLLPFLGEHGYDEALVLLAVERLRAWYQRQGHYRVEVDYREELGDGRLDLSLDVRPGPVYTLEEVRFEGNREVGDDQLRELTETAPRGLWGIGGGKLVDEVLEADLDNLRAYYALAGYRGTEVGPPEIDETESRLTLTVPIVEGTRQQVADLRFEGVESLDLDAVRGRLSLTSGGPFHPRRLDDSLNQIRAEYERQGFDQAQVSAQVDWDPDQTLAAVTVQVLEGPQTLVDRLIVRGNQRTEDEVIRRTIDLERGEPVSRSRLLDVERQLYRLGICSRVEVDLTPAPCGATDRDVLVRVEEGKVRRVSYGLGYDTEDGLGGLFGFTHNNLLGKAFSLTVDARVREQRQQYRLILDQPYFAKLKVPVTYSVFRLEETRETFEVTKWGTRIDVVEDLGARLAGARLALSYDYRIVENVVTADLEPFDPDDDFDREDQTLRISSLIPNFQLDRRDDPLDPSRGWSSVVQLQYAFPFLSAEGDFVKLFAQHTQYFDLGGAGVLAASVRAGGIEPLGELDMADPLVPPELPSSDIFLAERFFAGGSSTHRAFDRDRLGIPDRSLFPDAAGDLVPAGGNGLLRVNLDYRFPILGPIGGTVFYDTGNVWADWRDIDRGDLRAGVGVGLRYISPIGPIRLEIGWPLDRLAGDDPNVIFLSLGNPF